MLEVEVEGREYAPDGPTDAELQTAVELAVGSAGIGSGHLAIHFVDEARSFELAAEHLGKDDATDVISFPVDGDDEFEMPGPRELGDVVICPERTVDLLEATVHGALHLVGMDHEVDDGEMLALQAELMSWLR